MEPTNVLIIMKANLFAKPDLKLFLLSALLLVAVKELVLPAGSGMVPLKCPAALLEGKAPSQKDMDHLKEFALLSPTCQSYMLLSEGHRKRGELHQAMHYLRQASLAAEIGAFED